MKRTKPVEKEKAGSRNSRLKLEERIILQEPINHFLENEVVLATIPGYAPWPARIVGISAETIFVEFFGTGQMWVSKNKNLVFFNTSQNIIFFRNPVRSGALSRFDVKKVIPLLQRRGYRKAVRELEFILGIPKDVSVI